MTAGTGVMTLGNNILPKDYDKLFKILVFSSMSHFCPSCDAPGLEKWDQCCTGWCFDVQSSYLQPTPAKVIRLVFHDCMK